MKEKNGVRTKGLDTPTSKLGMCYPDGKGTMIYWVPPARGGE